MSPVEVVFIVIQLIFLEGILSIDNAAVLGAMVSELPANKSIPWPRQLEFMQEWGDRMLGGQRVAALKVGILGAYFGRALMLLMAVHIIQNPWLRLLGAAYLLKLSISHLGIDPFARRRAAQHPDDPHQTVVGGSFWQVVLLVELADLAFSIDNVVAAVALSDHILIVMLGVALGIVTMRFAAQIFTHLIEREPILAPTAYLLVLNISAELLIEEAAEALGYTIHFSNWQKFIISIGTIVLALLYIHSPTLYRILHPFIHAMRLFFGVINHGFDWLLRPFAWLFSWLVSSVRGLFRRLSSATAR